MDDFYCINQGNVCKYTTEDKVKINNIKMYHIIYIVITILAFLSTYLVFINCIDENKALSNTIALGSIFATFGSALVGVFSLVMGSCYDRFLSNYYILFSQLEPGKKWQRWAFIKRESHQTLFNQESAYQVLTNAKVVFNVGSHSIELFIPTIKEDFYDLPNWKSLKQMQTKSKDYESHVLSKCDRPDQALMVWHCIYDNFLIIAKYKIAKAIVVLGVAYLMASIVMAFLYRII